MENLKYVKVPRNVAGYGKLELFYKSPGTWQVMETLIKKHKSPGTWQVPDTLIKKDKSPGTWQVPETLIKKKRAPNESTFSRPKTLRGVSYRCPVSARVLRVPPKNVATGPRSQNLR
jgi:hypothetical protein